MKRQIAAFLGELAEELGWAPELEESRVRPEETESAHRTSERMPSVVPRFASPVDILSAELKQLRKTVNHLGSEVTHLRTQLAKVRRMPIPPDAEESSSLEMPLAPPPRSGPGPSHLVPETADRIPASQQTAGAVDERVSVPPAPPKPLRVESTVEVDVDDDLSYEQAVKKLAELTRTRDMKESSKTVAKTKAPDRPAVAVSHDGETSPLELFPAEHVSNSGQSS